MATANIMSETANTDTPRERAFALYCQGQRSPAIATKLGVPERTIRAWITTTLRKLTEENAAQRRDHQALAIARYEAISNAAWEGYARAAALEQATLTATLTSLTTESAAESATPSSSPSAPSAPSAVSPSVLSSAPSVPSVPSVVHSPRPTAGARYLAVAMAADREISRLQGLHLPDATKPQQDVKIILERREPTAENFPPGAYPGAPINDVPPTTPFTPTDPPSATPTDPVRVGGLRGGTPLGAVLTAGSPTATTFAVDASADSLPLPPARAREGGQGVRSPASPAETATPSSSPSASVPSVYSVVNPSAASPASASVCSVCSVVNPSASSVSSAVSPSAPSAPSASSAVNSSAPPPPAGPRIWKRRPGSPYPTGIYITYGDDGANGFGYRP